MSDFEKLIKAITNIEEAIQQGAQNGLKQAGIRVMGTAKAKLGTYQKCGRISSLESIKSSKH